MTVFDDEAIGNSGLLQTEGSTQDWGRTSGGRFLSGTFAMRMTFTGIVETVCMSRFDCFSFSAFVTSSLPDSATSY